MKHKTKLQNQKKYAEVGTKVLLVNIEERREKQIMKT